MKLRARSKISTGMAVEAVRATMRDHPGKGLADFVAAFDGFRKDGFTLQAAAFAALLTLSHKTTQRLTDRLEALEQRPSTRYCGIHEAGATYQIGDMVTRAGSMWACLAETTDTPGNGSPAWRLCVKRGRAG